MVWMLLALDLDGLRDGLHLSLELLLQFCEGHPEHRLQIAHEPVHVSLPWHLVNDVLVVVVTETSAQFLVVHLRLVLPRTPAPGHLLWVNQLELPLPSRPGNAILAIAIRQQFQQKLPELDGAGARGVGRSDLGGWAGAGGRIGTVHWRMERGGTGGGHGGPSGGGVRGGAIREGGASGTVERVRGRLKQSTVGCEGSSVYGEIVV